MVAVPLHLRQGMAELAVESLDQHEMVVVLEQVRLAPLLELDHDVGVLTCPRVDTGEYDVRSLAGEGKLVLDEHLDLAEPRLDEVPRQHGHAPRPGVPLGRGRKSARGRLEMIGQHAGELSFHR